MAASRENLETTPLLTNTEPGFIRVNGSDGRGETAKGVENGGEETETFRMSSLTTRSKLTFLLCALANLFSNTAFALPAPFYPEEAKKKGVTTSLVGIIFAVFQFVIFIASPILGIYLTRVGAKFMFVAGILLGGCCSILFGVLYLCPPGTPFIAISLACRSVEALGLAAFITASFAIISNEFPKHVGTVFGILETFSGIGLMVGPAVGGALYEVGGFGLPFFVVGSAVILNGSLILLTLPIPEDLSTERNVSVLKLLRSPIVIIVLYDITVAALGISFLDPTFANHLKKFHLSTLYVGLVFVIAPGLYAITAPVWGYITDHKDIKAVSIIIGNLICCCGYFLIGPSNWLPFLPFQLWLVILGTVLIGMCFGCSVVPAMKFMLAGAFELGFEDNLDTYGIVSGLFNTGFCFGALIGPILSGVLVDNIGFREAASIIAVLHFSAVLFSSIFFLVRRSKKKSKEYTVQVSDESQSQGRDDKLPVEAGRI